MDINYETLEQEAKKAQEKGMEELQSFLDKIGEETKKLDGAIQKNEEILKIAVEKAYLINDGENTYLITPEDCQQEIDNLRAKRQALLEQSDKTRQDISNMPDVKKSELTQNMTSGAEKSEMTLKEFMDRTVDKAKVVVLSTFNCFKEMSASSQRAVSNTKEHISVRINKYKKESLESMEKHNTRVIDHDKKELKEIEDKYNDKHGHRNDRKNKETVSKALNKEKKRVLKRHERQNRNVSKIAKKNGTTVEVVRAAKEASRIQLEEKFARLEQKDEKGNFKHLDEILKDNPGLNEKFKPANFEEYVAQAEANDRMVGPTLEAYSMLKAEISACEQENKDIKADIATVDEAIKDSNRKIYDNKQQNKSMPEMIKDATEQAKETVKDARENPTKNKNEQTR